MLRAVAALALLVLCAAQRPPLRFREDGTFKLMQITDLHYGEAPDKDVQSDQVQHTVLAAERPDLVVFSGDMVSGWFNPKQEQGWFETRWRQLIGPAQAAATPYAAILGNHDAEAELSRWQIVALDVATGDGLSLTRHGPRNVTGASNYYVDIMEASGTGVAARIWLFDSMNRRCGDVELWGCVGADTVAWFRRTAARLPPVLTSVAFVHIPLPEFMDAWAGGADSQGGKGEDVCCPGVDTGLFKALAEAGVGSVWCGHDHNNDYFGVKDGVVLGFGRKSGYGSYGPEGRLHGARVVQLQAGQPAADAETWIAQEDGSRDYQTAAREPIKQQSKCSDGGADAVVASVGDNCVLGGCGGHAERGVAEAR